MKFTLQRIGVALALVYIVGTPAVAAILLFADNSNAVLLACIVYWLQRTKPARHVLAEAVLVPLCARLARAAHWYVRRGGHAHIDDIITDHDSLVAFYRARAADRTRRPVPRLCPNGDHGNVEETLIILREHAQKISGAAITAVFLSALLTCTLQALSSAVATTRSNIRTAQVSTAPAAPMLTADEQFQADFDALVGTPRAYYRAPPADASAVVVVYRDAVAAIGMSLFGLDELAGLSSVLSCI